MSKRELKKYLDQLPQDALQEQILMLYEKFVPVKTYYDFVFHPKEEQLLEQAKVKIRHEYFPAKSRKAKARRSTAQKFIKHYMNLGLEPNLLADLMMYNLETVVAFSAQKKPAAAAFYKSHLNAFEQLVHYLIEQGLTKAFYLRLSHVLAQIQQQEWPDLFAFELHFEKL